MPLLEVEFEVQCTCGNGLCNQSTVDNKGRYSMVTVEPCERCKDDSYNKGYEAGYEAGYDAAIKEGGE